MHVLLVSHGHAPQAEQGFRAQKRYQFMGRMTTDANPRPLLKNFMFLSEIFQILLKSRIWHRERK